MLQVNTAFFSPDGDLILSAAADKTARLWCVQTGAGATGYGLDRRRIRHESLRIQTPPDRVGLMVEKSHPQNRIIGIIGEIPDS